MDNSGIIQTKNINNKDKLFEKVTNIYICKSCKLFLNFYNILFILLGIKL